MARKRDWIIGGVILAAIGGFFILFVVLIFSLGSSNDVSIGGSGGKIAVIELDGVITSSKKIVRQFIRFNKNDQVKAIVFRINSPGGGVAASQEIYEHVKRVRDGGKPVIASLGSVAASGGYYVALGADSIMANPGTTTGSIGVIAEIPNLRRLMDKIGISFTIIKSGKFKDTGSPYRDISAEEHQYLQQWIDNGYEQFVAAVANERHMDVKSVKKLADGRVYSGEQAFQHGLIDTLGTFQDAIDLAAQVAGISGEPRIIRERQEKLTIFDLLGSDLKKSFNEYLGTWPRVKYQLSF